WVHLGTQSFITYPNLPPGHYQLRVQACNAEGIWTSENESLHVWVVVHPHFTQTNWFKFSILGCALALVGFATTLYYRYRLRAKLLLMEKQQREAERKQLQLEQQIALRDQRDQISQGIHDDLGAGLSGIRITSERAIRQFDPQAAVSWFQKIARLAGELDENRRSLSWATDPEMDSLGSLLARIRREATALFENTGIQLTMNIPIDFEDQILFGVHRILLLRAVKEGLNNSLRHAEATEISLQILISTSELVILIRDNGIGFDANAVTAKGKGLSSIHKQMEKLGGSAEWIRPSGGGTILRLYAPLPIN
ncbi:MAG: hypothetical protein JNJ57_19955, partial [Saprospiraceae bacterium]|nr:hypothetical protein [Saprospiraceae bacterium]